MEDDPETSWCTIRSTLAVISRNNILLSGGGGGGGGGGGAHLCEKGSQSAFDAISIETPQLWREPGFVITRGISPYLNERDF